MNGKRIFVNALTFSRVPFIFAWLGLAILGEFQGEFWYGFWGAVMLTASGLTDLFDGMLARKWNAVSTLGKMADPLMDKVFYVVTFPRLPGRLRIRVAMTSMRSSCSALRFSTCCATCG